MDVLNHALGAIAPYVAAYGLPAVFIILFFESFGVPLPGESLLIAAGLLASQGQMPLVPLMAVAYVASVMGDNFGYLIGRNGGRAVVIRHGARIGITSGRMQKAEAFFARFGGTIVVFARFFAVLRQLNGLVAGITAMPWQRFLACNAIGAALWVAVWTLGPVLVGRQLHVLLPLITSPAFVAGGAAVAAAGLAIWWWYRRSRAAG